MNELNLSNIKAIRKGLGLNQEDVAKKLNIELATYGKIERGDIKLTVERLYEIADILKTTPEFILNYHLGQSNDKVIHPTKSELGWNVMYVPVRAHAGKLSEIEQTTYREYYHLPGLSGTDNFMIDVEGDSMAPTVLHGDMVVIKKLASDVIRWGEIYVVDCIDGMVIKRIFQCKKNDKLLELHSDNSFFHPYEIEKKNILSIWHLKECLTKNLSPRIKQ